MRDTRWSIEVIPAPPFVGGSHNEFVSPIVASANLCL